jgi:hypothetical protein
VREPAVYRPETSVLDHPVSWITGSTKTDTTYVCPGADVKITSQEMPAMIQP